MNITLRNVSKKIKKNIILQNINIEMKDHMIYGLVGSNGSGKTMLMRIIAGLVSYDEGKLLVNNKTVKHNGKIHFNMGVIIEKPEFFNDMNGLNNLILLAKLKNCISKEDIIKAMNLVGLDPNNTKKVKEYSLGMKQRLAVAQAIMENPDVLILDEVTNALDEDGIGIVHKILKEEKRKGKLIIISSHNKQDIEYLCDKVYVIKNQTVY